MCTSQSAGNHRGRANHRQEVDNLLAGPTATDELSKFFGVTSRIQQTRLISEAQESIETDASEDELLGRAECGRVFRSFVQVSELTFWQDLDVFTDG